MMQPQSAWPGVFRDAGLHRLGEFAALGYRGRDLFPHRVYRLCKGGPDGLVLSRAMCGLNDPSRLREIVLYALPPAVDEFPHDLLFDDDLYWHAQQFGLPGQVASADLVRDGDRLYGMAYVSDLCQRVPRRREWKTRVESTFQGWRFLLLNAILDYAVDSGMRVFYSPTSEWALRHTDPARVVQAPMFQRIYDRTVLRLFDATREGNWWRIDVAKNRNRRVTLEPGTAATIEGKTVSISHDVERGMGHRRVDPAFAQSVDGTAPESLRQMLAIERSRGVRATYNVVGSFLQEVRAGIVQDGHALAFHSYDHNVRVDVVSWIRRLGELAVERVRPPLTEGYDQLHRCRLVDRRLKGYRPPRSRITPGLNDRNLSQFNFEWLASSASSLAMSQPHLVNGIVKIPIAIDDFSLYRGSESYEEWERRALALVERHEFTAIGLHDCYGRFWLPHYESFLDKVSRLARPATLDQVAARVTLARAE